MTTQVPSRQYLLDFSQILLLKSHLEEVIGIVDFLLKELTLSVEGEDLVLHEESHV
jgi:hypothetical protein